MDIKNEVLKTFAKLAKKDNITVDSNIKELGLDSLDLVDNLMDIEAEYGIEFENEEMTSFVTINDVINCVSKKIK